MVQNEVLAKVPGDGVAVFVVWIPTFPGDSKEKAVSARSLVSDRRARHFWDGERGLGKRYHDLLSLPEAVGVAWDIYVVFDREVGWESSPPLPVFWQHQLSVVDEANRLDGETFREALEARLSESH